MDEIDVGLRAGGEQSKCGNVHVDCKDLRRWPSPLRRKAESTNSRSRVYDNCWVGEHLLSGVEHELDDRGRCEERSQPSSIPTRNDPLIEQGKDVITIIQLSANPLNQGLRWLRGQGCPSPKPVGPGGTAIACEHPRDSAHRHQGASFFGARTRDG